jgi:hypothetical protein
LSLIKGEGKWLKRFTIVETADGNSSLPKASVAEIVADKP